MLLTGIRAVILDIEGTIGSIDYVRTVLFPYALRRYAAWVRDLEPHERQRLREKLQTQVASCVRNDTSVIALLQDLTDRDVKSAILKEVQQSIWHTGFVRGELRGHVYSDVAPALSTIRQSGKSTYIYSSGDARAQKDWFRYSSVGDLTSFIDGYFDLNSAGSKADPSSYRRIARAIGLPAESMLFLSDAVAELNAACVTGASAAHVIRGCGPIDVWDRGPVLSSLADIDATQHETMVLTPQRSACNNTKSRNLHIQSGAQE